VSTPKVPFALLLLALGAPASAATEYYCCTDPGNGRRICGDTLPAQCRGRAYRIFDKAGNPLRDVAAAMTAEEKAAAAVAAKREKRLEEERLERRRMDAALLSTYATPEDIDMAQDKAENDANLTIRDATEKIVELQKRQGKLVAEAEFYKRAQLPPALASDLHTVNHEIRLQQELIELKRKDLANIRAKYDSDRQRYYELTGRRSISRPASPSTTR